MKIRKIIPGILGFCLAASVLCPEAFGQKLIKIAAGFDTSFFIKSDGSLWGMGQNYNSQLGDGTTIDRGSPEQIISNNVITVATGDGHTLFVKSGGSLWSTGLNDSGQLGDGTTIGRNIPEMIVSNGVVAVAAGYSHSFFIKSDGSLWGMGVNTTGQLGDGTATNQLNPVLIISNGVAAVAAGEFDSFFIKSDGSLWGMGGNFNGEMGDGTMDEHDSPVLIIASNVVAVAAGGEEPFVLFVKSDGSLWGIGYNYDGELGNGIFSTSYPYSITTPEQIIPGNVIAIAAGDYHSLFLKSDGSLWGMGWNGFGALGDFTSESRDTPVLIVSNNVVATIAGGYHSLFLKSNGSLWGMGNNTEGAVGDGTMTNQFRPVLIVPSPPALLGLSFSGENLIFHGTNGLAGGAYSVLTSTNVALPLIQWTSISTNLLNTNGSFTITATNALNPTAVRQFYTLRLNQ